MANYKAEATAQQIAADIANRISPTLTAVVDLSGTDPVINFGNVAVAGGRAFIVKVLDQRGGVDAGWKALPGFGNVTQPVYTGTVVQIAYERALSGNWPISTSILPDDLVKIVGDLTRRGARVELWSSANTVAPAFTLQTGTFDPNLYYPVQGRV
jgi:hypothetical protein